MANIGQDEDFKSAEAKAKALGAEEVIIKDLCLEFLETTIYPTIQGNCMYEGVYLMGTAV